MKFLSLLMWVGQFGFSIIFPTLLFLLIAVWLRDRFGLGAWCILTALALGLICAVSGLRQSLLLMEKMHRQNHKDDPAVPGFNEHT